MALVTDEIWLKKLKNNNIDIETTYLVNKNLITKKNNDYSNDDIIDGIIYAKKYYLNNNLVKKEDKFDPRIKYSFLSKNMLSEEYTCVNCGMRSKKEDFINGCPYCRTVYNIDYEDKNIGNKYFYDYVIHNNIYRLITLIIDIVLSFFLCYLIIKSTSRTFNNYDIYKIVIYGIIASFVFYYFFYIIDAYIILLPIKLYKTNENEKRKLFWEETNLNKKTFFNNLNYELSRYYFKKEKVIDFDILDYNDFNYYEKNNDDCIEVNTYIRIVYLENNILKSKYLNEKFTFIKNKNESSISDSNKILLKFHGCGNSVSINDQECKYCHKKIIYNQEWILINN